MHDRHAQSVRLSPCTYPAPPVMTCRARFADCVRADPPRRPSARAALVPHTHTVEGRWNGDCCHVRACVRKRSKHSVQAIDTPWRSMPRRREGTQDVYIPTVPESHVSRTSAHSAKCLAFGRPLLAVRACSLPSSLSHARHARAVERFRCYRLARLPHPIALARSRTATRALGTSCVLTPLRAMLWQGQSVVAQHSLRADERRERGAGALAAFLTRRAGRMPREGGRSRESGAESTDSEGVPCLLSLSH